MSGPLFHFGAAVGGRAPDMPRVGGILSLVAEAKPRILQGNRDMFWSVVVLMVMVGIFAGVAGQCTFSPSGPQQGAIPEFDADASLRQDARSLPFPIRSPEVPEGWTSNSGRVESFAGTSSSHVGWVTGERSFVELVQSDAPEDAFRSLGGGPRPDRTIIPVTGQEWTVFTGDDVRPVWVLDLDDVRVAVTGSAATSDFEALAASAQRAEPLPRER
ncbi:DUF4245 domain-containing protein [Rhodococcus sp. IEGM 1408]|uniref:DUF4245 domain-containing protein n=1 Tax=Rhodococcus sp. IEGM 1408 TaxID=3082220 RepID=UPI002955491D|nr:DUF4245 domain-containing protein [Rhodococcus sp. IEGM 1408]MDV8002603.1 DUF4245 domain-containing protein [Rhodococcus sp. IEGM 1408]